MSSKSDNQLCRSLDDLQITGQTHDEAGLAKINIQHFEYFKELGKGTYGNVYLVQKKDGVDKGQNYAMKTMFKENFMNRRSRTERVLSERDILSECRKHPFITKMFYAFEDKIAVHLVLELYPGGDVRTFIQKNGCLEGNALRAFVTEVFLGLDYLHKKGIVHRDLKPGNLLIDKTGHVVIADFGLSIQLTPPDTQIKGKTGTLLYMAPEMVSQGYYSYEVDMWSLGCTIHVVATKRNVFPFQFRDKEKLIKKIMKSDPSISLLLSRGLRDLITKLLHKSPSKRITKKQLVRHRYFKDVDWDGVKERSGMPPFAITSVSVRKLDEEQVSDIITRFKGHQKFDETVDEYFHYDFTSTVLKKNSLSWHTETKTK